MNYTETGIFQQKKVRIKNLLPDIGIENARKEIADGLMNGRPAISSKFFYDQKGSLLFEEITKLEEYYPTRTEKGILTEMAPVLMPQNSAMEIIELGSGDCSKISILLEAANGNMANMKYIPVDFSQSAISDAANILCRRYPQLEIEAYVADFIHQLNLIPHSDKPRMVCFLGSTIGNFSMPEAREIIRNLAGSLFKNDSLLVGFDLIKAEDILHAAYNDAKGVTAHFNKNILKVVNGVVESDFSLDDFEHKACFNAQKSRIEMHLVANKGVQVSSPFFEKDLKLSRGESIHTENSHKYSMDSIHELIVGSGLSIKNTFTDPSSWFIWI